MTILERLDAAVEESAKLREQMRTTAMQYGYVIAMKHMEDFVSVKSSYSVCSHELLTFIKLNAREFSTCLRYRSENLEEE